METSIKDRLGKRHAEMIVSEIKKDGISKCANNQNCIDKVKKYLGITLKENDYGYLIFDLDIHYRINIKSWFNVSSKVNRAKRSRLIDCFDYKIEASQPYIFSRNSNMLVKSKKETFKHKF